MEESFVDDLDESRKDELETEIEHVLANDGKNFD